MKLIQFTGLSLFIIGFGIFIGSFFTSNYQPTEERLGALLSSEEMELLKENAILGNSFSSNFAIVSSLNTAFEGINKQALETYSNTTGNRTVDYRT
jgi:hypothetical protein